MSGTLWESYISYPFLLQWFYWECKTNCKKTFGIYIIRKLQKPGPRVSSELLVYWLIIYYENSIYIQLSGLDVLVKNNCVRDFSVAPDSVNWLSCSSNKPAIQDEVALFTLSLNTCCSINKLRCIGCFSIHIRMKNPRRLKNVSGVADVVCVCCVGGLGGGRGPRCCYLVHAATACRHWGARVSSYSNWSESTEQMLSIKDRLFFFFNMMSHHPGKNPWQHKRQRGERDGE